MSYDVEVQCPICSTTVSIEVTSTQEYQGEYPMGGVVTFVEATGEVDQYCQCQLTDKQWSILAEKACDVYEKEEDYEEPLDYEEWYLEHKTGGKN